MKRWYVGGLAIGMSLVIAGCSETPPPAPDTRAADEKAIRDGETAWNADFTAKDSDKLVNHYADDATFMAPNEPLAKGKDSIRAALKGFLDDKNFALSFAPATVEVAKSGDVAYSQGTYALTISNPKTGKPFNETGKYVTVYKKQAGGFWKAVEDINTPDAPAAPPAPAKKAKAKAKAKAARRKKG